MDSRPKKLLDQVRETIQLKHYSSRTGQTYIDWIKRYILFHNKRHPREMGVAEIEAFLTYLAVDQRVAASTQNQTLCALLFLYREVLRQDLGDIQAIRAKWTPRLPTVLTREETLRVIGFLTGTYQLMAKLLDHPGRKEVALGWHAQSTSIELISAAKRSSCCGRPKRKGVKMPGWSFGS